MKFSIVQIVKTRDSGNIDGNWLQNHVGTVESATKVAVDTEKANGNKIEVAVVGQVCGDVHGDPYRIDLTRLDQPRSGVSL